MRIRWSCALLIRRQVFFKALMGSKCCNCSVQAVFSLECFLSDFRVNDDSVHVQGGPHWMEVWRAGKKLDGRHR